MSRVCQVTGKRTRVGNNRSHSMRATKRKFYPNLFKVKVKDPETGIYFLLKVSAAGKRTLKKKGII